MNKFITLILCLCCVFTSAWAEGDDHTSLNPSDANIVGHILDKKTGEHLSAELTGQKWSVNGQKATNQ